MSSPALDFSDRYATKSAESAEYSPYRKSDSHAGSQENPRLLWHPKITTEVAAFHKTQPLFEWVRKLCQSTLQNGRVLCESSLSSCQFSLRPILHTINKFCVGLRPTVHSSISVNHSCAALSLNNYFKFKPSGSRTSPPLPKAGEMSNISIFSGGGLGGGGGGENFNT